MASKLLKTNLTAAVRELTGMPAGPARKQRADALYRELQAVDERWVDSEIGASSFGQTYYLSWAELNRKVRIVRTEELALAGTTKESESSIARAKAKETAFEDVPGAIKERFEVLKGSFEDSLPTLGLAGLGLSGVAVALLVVVVAVAVAVRRNT